MARTAAALILQDIVAKGHLLEERFSASAVPNRLQALDPRDRALTRSIVTSALRRLGTIRQAIAKLLENGLPRQAPDLEWTLIVGAAQILLLDVPDHAAVDLAVRAVRLDRKTAPFAALVNAVMRNVARGREAILAASDPLDNDVPGWLATRWRKTYGEDVARRIGAAIREEPTLDLTVKADPAAWAERVGGRVLPTGSVRLETHAAIDGLPGYDDGAWWVQDAAAALPATFLKAQPGQRIADFCAAPGGKSAQIAAAGASLTAIDRSAERLKRLSANLERLGLEAELIVADATGLKAQPYDAVLLDAPCLGTGTLRRHPDIAWTKKPGDLANLVALQSRLLDKAVELTRPGGTIVYCTCSIEPEEGEAQIAALLRRNPRCGALADRAGRGRRPVRNPQRAGRDAQPALASGRPRAAVRRARRLLRRPADPAWLTKPRDISAICANRPARSIPVTRAILDPRIGARPGRMGLAGATFKDRLGIATLLAGQAGRRIRATVALPARAVAKLRATSPDRLLIAPQDIRTTDPTIAADIAAGYFAFGGRIVNARGRSPFAIDADIGDGKQSEDARAWSRQLAGFGWLRHLRAADNPLTRQRGRQLVADFLDTHERTSTAAAWEPRVAARRMLAWLSQSPVILAGADRAFYNRFMRALSTHRAFLQRRIAGGLVGEDRLLVALALAEFGLCAEASGTLQRAGTTALVAEIDAQVLADGGAVSRNPQTTIDLLLDLLPLRQAYAARGIQAPQQLLNAIDRMMPMMRLFRHGDGTLALFNGMGVTAPELVATILAYDDARAKALTNARHAGYQRIEAGSTILVVEAGAVPPPVFSTRAHAGCLSFELSSGARRIIVNCGAPEAGRTTAREAARTTAAHSTLIIDDTSSCRFAANAGLGRWLGEQILAGPTAVDVERTETDAATRLALSHDGYEARFGLVHHRTLTLDADGARLTGVDAITPVGKRKPAPTPFVLRFHLHSAVKARAADDGRSVRLEVTDDETWLLDSSLPVIVEPSILFASAGGPRPTRQIRIAADTGTCTEVRWSLRRLTLAPTPRR